MKIKRFSVPFLFTFACVLISLLFISIISLKSHITYQDYKELGLPVLFIETEYRKKINSKIDYLSANYSLETFDGQIVSGDCKIRGRGNTTWRTRELYKKPYLLKLNTSESLLGMNNATKWVLMANTADKTSLRNFYAEYLATNIWNAQQWTPKSQFITLVVNGRYEGLYALTEKIEIQPGRIEVGGTDSFLAEVHSQQNKEWNFRSEKDIPFSIRTEFEGLSETQLKERYTKLQNIIQNIENVIFSENFKDELTGYRNYIDVNTFVDWFLVNEFTKNHDARFQSSCYMYFDSEKQKLFMGPSWDFDISCGNISWDNCDKAEGNFINTDDWYKRLFEDEYFKMAVVSRWQEKQSQILKSFDWLKEQAKIYYPAIMLNDAIWKNIGNRQWPHAPGWKNRKTYQDELDYLTSWLEKRRIWMDNEYNTL